MFEPLFYTPADDTQTGYVTAIWNWWYRKGDLPPYWRKSVWWYDFGKSAEVLVHHGELFILDCTGNLDASL